MSSPSGFLDGISLFDTFSADERAALEGRGRVFEVAAGTVLMREGDEADSLYVLLDGTVRVVRADAAGGQVEVGFRVAGECFGEMALIDGGTRSATVIAATPVRAFELERDLFLALISPSPELLSKLLKALSRQIRDVSERVVREDLERRTLAAEAALARHRAITRAVTGLAHELNTPLGVCVLAASHLQELGEGGEALREPVALLRENLDRAVDLVEAFTTIAACENFEAPETLDLAEAVERAAALHALAGPQPPLAIRIERDGPCPWVGYSQQLERVLHCLFANVAAHAYPAGAGGPVAVTVAADLLDGKPAWRLTVRDSGAGIPPDLRGVLTDAFFTTARGRGHKGLGLTLVHNTVTGPLGGRLAIDGAPGAGTAVTILVPQAL